MPFKKLAVTAAVLLLCVAAERTAYHFYGPRGELTRPKTDTSRSKGKIDAPLWITEYMDYQCQTCALAYPLLESYLKDHPGRIYLQVKSYPVVGHQHGEIAAVYAECAARQRAFWPYHETVLMRQSEWVSADDPTPLFRQYANEAAMDLAELDRCASDPSTLSAVRTEAAAARALGVRGTPSFFIDGKLVVGEIEFKKTMRSYLEKKDPQ